MLIAFDDTLLLGVDDMDDTHREFVELVNRMGDADTVGFIELFPLLIAHTERHFENETSLMRQSGFPAIREHMDEHLRILGELGRLAHKVARGSVTLARAYVQEHLPAWFRLHAATMDSALAAHVKHQGPSPVFASAALH
ncbi:MAG: hemerythrin domain-containing protein [Gammaproteobacteria bacterium]|nr:hemerythrin domain-containing protein [Gammaproteobacteria bacterium]